MVKKTGIIVMILFAVCSLSRLAYGLEMSAGATMWYTDWSPHWEKEFRDVFADESSERSSFTMDTTYLYGPVVALRISERVGLTGSFLYGRYNASSYKMWAEGGIPRIMTSEMKVMKLDSDLILSYSFLGYFQLFLGGKYQRYELQETQQGLYQIASPPFGRDLSSNSYGPGMGVGVTIPLAENFAILWNISGIVLSAKIRDEWSEESGALPPTYTYTLNAYGGNTTVSFAYSIESADITIITGFRYQYLYYTQRSISKHNYDPSDEFRFPRDYDGESDRFLGISMSVVYSFTL